MTPRIKILSTIRSEDLIRAATLVFDTIRTGYPTAEVEVFLNKIPEQWAKYVRSAALNAGAKVTSLEHGTIHHYWIEALVDKEKEPFILLDTDIVFFQSCESWGFNSPLAGRLIPRFNDPFTKCITMPRLHTSHLYVSPVEVRESVAKYKEQFPSTIFNPLQNLFYPTFFPLRSDKQANIFYDTCAMLYHAIGGTNFTDEQLDCYEHIHCGTISDIVEPYIPGLRNAHAMVFENPKLAKGAWKQQEAFYKRNAI